MFSFNTFNQKTAISLPHDYMLVIPEDLSLQLGLRGKVYLGRRTRPEDMTDVNYRNHTVYVYTDIIKKRGGRPHRGTPARLHGGEKQL